MRIFSAPTIMVTRKRRKKTYSRKDYESNDGMMTTIWGPPLWHVLHTLSFNYPVKPSCEDKKNFRNFILALGKILPCRHCRENLKKNLKKFPLTQANLRNRDALSRWMYGFHEHINKMLGKTSGLTFSTVRERYEHFRSRCTVDKTRNRRRQRRRGSGRTRRRKKEKGCVEPLFGKKSKCVMKIVPKEERTRSFQMDKRCIKRRA